MSGMPGFTKTAAKREEIIEFGDQKVRILRRAFQRTLRMQVKPTGELLLTSGLTQPNRHLLKFLEDSWPWVVKTLAKVEKQREKFPKPRYSQGELLPVLGVDRQLVFRESHNHSSRVKLEGRELVIEVAKSLWINFMPSAEHPEWRDPIRRFYEREGRKLLGHRAEVFARLMALQPTGLSFRCQRTRWGSCSSNGRISLNWRLVAAPLAVLDYVVIHEIAHLKFPNHSARFWNLVAEFCPAYDEHNAWLRQNHLALEFLL